MNPFDMESSDDQSHWSDLFDMNALMASIEALQARVAKLEEDRDHMLDYINEQNYIQPSPLPTWQPRNRSHFG